MTWLTWVLYFTVLFCIEAVTSDRSVIASRNPIHGFASFDLSLSGTSMSSGLTLLPAGGSFGKLLLVVSSEILLVDISRLEILRRIKINWNESHESSARLSVRSIPGREEWLMLCRSSCWVVELRKDVEIITLNQDNSLNLLRNDAVEYYFEFDSSKNVNQALSKSTSRVENLSETVPLFVATTSLNTETTSRGNNSTRTLASLMLTWKNNIPQMNYRYSSGSNISALNFNMNYPQNLEANIIYSFEDFGFIYYLVLHKNKNRIRGSSMYETRLGRFCKNDVTFNSYMEIELSCSSPRYEIARSAYLLERASTGSGNSNENVLYVVFHDVEDSALNQGTRICGYSMSKVRKEFLSLQQQCYTGNGKILPWINASPQAKCISNFEIYKRINDEFCGSPLNRGIGGRYPLSASSTFYTDEFTVTSLVAMETENKTVAAITDSQGRIIKVLLHGVSNLKAYGIKSITKDSAENSVSTQMILEHREQAAFILSGTRLSKYPLSSCSIYADCGSCVTGSDPLGCGWCHTPGRCTAQQECLTGLMWTSNSCPPVIDKFEPRSGPTEGGTMMRIYGSNFGSAKGSASVTVSNTNCLVQSINNTLYDTFINSLSINGLTEQHIFNEITCTTEASNRSGEVFVVVNDSSLSSLKYKIQGSASSSSHQIFSYMTAVFSSYTPSIGLKSHSTVVTLKGKNLNIGSSHSVKVAGRICEIKRMSADQIVCVTSSSNFSSAVRSSAEQNVELVIDLIALKSKESFIFVSDPVIHEVSPLKNFMSGGLPVTITGNNFHAIQGPTLFVRINASDDMKYYGNCSSNAKGSRLICLSPNISHLVPDSSVPFTVNISLGMNNGFTSSLSIASLPESMNQLLYSPDPDVHSFTDKLKIMDEEMTNLRITGERLALAAGINDYLITVGRDECVGLSLEDEVLECRLPDKDIDSSCTTRCPVQVKVGSLVFNVGYMKRASAVLQLWPSSDMTDLAVVVTIILLFILAIICISTFLWVKCLRRRKSKKPFRAVSNVLYTSGPGGEQAMMQTHPLRNTYSSQMDCNQLQATAIEEDDVYNLLKQSNLLIPSDRLILCDVVGQGNFGCVYRGLLKNEVKGETEVAVKTLRSLTDCIYRSSSQSESRKIIGEAMVMREFNHIHILRLIGIVLDQTKRLPLVVLPFMKHGDLLTYIRDNKNSPTVKDLMNFSIQIAEGMSYLSSLKFVHRDLATRNCMLDDSMLVKVADFGLSRDIYERDYYSSDDKKAKLPVKWMALESLEKGVYSSKSDVWSFGVVLWELLTRGVCPYPEVDSWDIIRYLRSGRRLAQPAYCPDALYQLALQCWHPDPNHRPSFETLSLDISDMISSLEHRQDSRIIGVNPEHPVHSTRAPDGYLIPLSASNDSSK